MLAVILIFAHVRPGGALVQRSLFPHVGRALQFPWSGVLRMGDFHVSVSVPHALASLYTATSAQTYGRVWASISMKYVVPLFRQPSGRASLGSVNWDTFQLGFCIVTRGSKFKGVTWDPWWRERKAGERRKKQRRSTPERRSHDNTEGQSFERLRLVPDRRASGNRRNDSDRRKSKSHENLIGFAAFRELGNRPLSDENARLLIRVCAGLTTRETYDGWIKTSGMAPFFKEPEWDAIENYKKFRVYAVASFLELLQAGGKENR